jgi:chromosome segregation ATPase
MENKDLIIIALIVVLIYLYYQNRKQKTLFYSPDNAEQAQEISETIANLKVENEDLIADKDQAIRDKNEAEAENLSLSNKLKLKSKEVENKNKEIQRLKEEKSTSEIALNKKLTELKKKYSEREKLLDTEQLECKKLEEKIEEKDRKIEELEQERSNLLDELSKDDDLTEFETWLKGDEENKAGLSEWPKVLNELKQRQRDYHLSVNNWGSNFLNRKTEYFKVFKEWLGSE